MLFSRLDIVRLKVRTYGAKELGPLSLCTPLVQIVEHKTILNMWAEKLGLELFKILALPSFQRCLYHLLAM